jgi:catechol 2,3-dioxygenase-like lactoylglutathione lyase family enzyme
VCAGIVMQLALLWEGGRDAFSKTSAAANPVIRFRFELHLEPEATRHSGANSPRASALSSPCGGCCWARVHWRNGNGKSDGNRRTVLPSSRSEGVGDLVPATPGRLPHTHELRGFRLATRGRPHRFRSFEETSDYFGDAHKVWMVNFRVRDLDKMAAQLRAAGIEVKIDPKSYPNGRFARVHDPEGNPIELWQPATPGAPR